MQAMFPRMLGAAILLGAFSGSQLRAAAEHAPDNSLSIQEYENAGVPSPDKSWEPADYVAAVKQLTVIAAQDPTHLPRFQSPRSGRLFARLVDAGYCDSLVDSALPLATRVKRGSSGETYASLFLLYEKASTPAQSFDTEDVEIAYFLLRMEYNALQLTKANAKAENSGSSETTELQRMHQGDAQSITGTIGLAGYRSLIGGFAAHRCLLHLEEILPKLVPDLERADQDKIRAQLSAAAAAEPDKGLQADYQRVLAALPSAPSSADDIQAQLAGWSRAIEKNPTDATAYNNRGCLRGVQGDAAGALADFDRAIALNPNYADAYYNRARMKNDQHDQAGALADYDKAIALNPRDPNPYFNRALIKREQGDTAGASRDEAMGKTLEAGGGQEKSGAAASATERLSQSTPSLRAAQIAKDLETEEEMQRALTDPRFKEALKDLQPKPPDASASPTGTPPR